MNWDLVAAAQSRLFVHWLNVWGTCSVRQESRLAPYLLFLPSHLFRMWPDGAGAAMSSGVRLAWRMSKGRLYVFTTRPTVA